MFQEEWRSILQDLVLGIVLSKHEENRLSNDFIETYWNLYHLFYLYPCAILFTVLSGWQSMHVILNCRVEYAYSLLQKTNLSCVYLGCTICKQHLENEQRDIVVTITGFGNKFC